MKPKYNSEAVCLFKNCVKNSIYCYNSCVWIKNEKKSLMIKYLENFVLI